MQSDSLVYSNARVKSLENSFLSQEKINKLFKCIPTYERAEKLMKDENLFFEYPHHISSAVIRGKTVRRIINVSFLAGKYIKNFLKRGRLCCFQLV